MRREQKNLNNKNLQSNNFSDLVTAWQNVDPSAPSPQAADWYAFVIHSISALPIVIMLR